MTDTASLSLPEGQLANELAVQLATFMWDHLGDDLSDGQICNIGQSNYEQGCAALNRIGVYRQGAHATLHHPVVPVQQVRAHMDAQAEVDRDTFEALLGAVLANFIDYGGGLSAQRAPFSVAPKLHPLARLLAQAGYAQWEDAQITWTDKPAPQMEQGQFWGANGVCPREVEDRAIQTQAQEIVDGMPPALRGKLHKAMTKEGFGTAIGVLQHHWTDAGWSEIPQAQKTGVPMKGPPRSGMRVYRQIFDLLAKGHA